MKEVFKKLIVDFVEKEISDIIERDINIPLISKKIISIIGARRTGKTFLLYSLINKLRKDNPRDSIVYINFEDDRLFPISLKDLDLFVEAYYELYPKNKNRNVYFLFDEVQNISNWEKFVRRLYDTEKCRIYITGSSSKLLSKEIATALRGRTISFEVFPFSFSEFLRVKGIDKNWYSSKNKAEIINAFESYLKGTAFPELVNASEMEKLKTLQEYVDLIIYKDIVERYKITNLFLVKYLVKFLLNNIGNLISVTKIYNDLKSQGISLAKNSLYQYLDHLEDAYVLFSQKLYSNNLREVQRNPRKIYSIDIGITDAMTISQDTGRRFENVVFLHLRRQYSDIYYFKIKQEIDFCYELEGKPELINAAFSISDWNTKQREIKSLSEGMDYFGLSESLLLTNTDEEVVTVNSKKINIVPLWKWLL